jgi:hypothetical protein
MHLILRLYLGFLKNCVKPSHRKIILGMDAGLDQSLKGIISFVLFLEKHNIARPPRPEQDSGKNETVFDRDGSHTLYSMYCILRSIF